MDRPSPTWTALALLALLLAGCTAPSPPPVPPPPPAGFAVGSAADAPVVVRLALADAKALYGEGSPLNLTVSTRGSIGTHLLAGVKLSRDVTLVSGSLDYNGSLPPGDLHLQAVVRGPPGNHSFRAWAEVPQPVGSRIAPSALLEVKGSAANATTAQGDESRPLFRVDFQADTVNPTLMAVRAYSVVGANIKLAIVLPDVLRQTGGNTTWEGFIVPGPPAEIRVNVAYDANWTSGNHTASAYLVPEPAIDGRQYVDTVTYSRQGGQVTATNNPPP